MTLRCLTIALGLAACTPDGEEPALTSDAEGTYAINKWTEGEDCAVADVEVDASGLYEFAVVEIQDTIMGEVLAVALCADAEACRASLDGEDGPGRLMWFTEGDDAAGWALSMTWTSEDSETGVCEAYVEDIVLTIPSEKSIRLEMRESERVPFPAGDDGYCWRNDAEDVARDAPCDTLSVVEAHSVTESAG